MVMDLQYNDYIVFVDESGDHELRTFDPQYPLFVLLFLLIRKEDYVDQACPCFDRLKFQFWGHNEIILHEHEIRKPKGAFGILQRKEVREAFLKALNEIMVPLPVQLVAIIIDKQKFVRQYANPAGPYEYAMELGLERIWKELESRNSTQNSLHVVVESRGRREDKELELSFRRIADGHNYLRQELPFELLMVPKAANSTGLQIADLMARPIGIHYLRPHQESRAFSIIEPKLRRNPAGETRGWGLKVIP